MNEAEFKRLRSIVYELARKLADVWPPRSAPDSTSDTTRTVKVVANASGGGKYTGYVWNDPAIDVLATGDLSASDMGTQGVACLILNAQEEGQTTHDLTSGTPKVTKFIGRLIHTNLTGNLPVYLINGSDWQNCT